MSLYECVFMARPDISPAQVDGLIETFTNIITEGSGSVEKTEYWGLRNLAYRVKKNRKAHYVLLNIDSPSPAVKEMERVMGLNEDILRTMTLRVDELETEPSVVMRNRGERRGRREDEESNRSEKPAEAKSEEKEGTE
jgi:small subunit ribosomal protein S6